MQPTKPQMRLSQEKALNLAPAGSGGIPSDELISRAFHEAV